jgi:hypothetical protein
MTDECNDFLNFHSFLGIIIHERTQPVGGRLFRILRRDVSWHVHNKWKFDLATITKYAIDANKELSPGKERNFEEHARNAIAWVKLRAIEDKIKAKNAIDDQIAKLIEDGVKPSLARLYAKQTKGRNK